MYLYRLSVAVVISMLFSATSYANEPSLTIEQGWIRAVPRSSADSVAYMTFINTSDQPLRLTGGSTLIAEMVMPMTTTRKTVNGQEVVGMKRVDELTIPAHGQLVLSPEGDHLMLMTLKAHPKPGEKIKVTLRFEPGEKELTIDLPVSLNKP
jgi:periplasmic copper chaperone A